MKRENLRAYKAIISEKDPSAIGKRIALLATDLDDASHQIRQQYGEDVIVSLWNEEDASAAR